MVYLDHNATAPMLPEAREAWLEAVEKYPGNPSSPHRLGARADMALTEARERLATMLGCHALDIVWTSGASEACNMAVHHAAVHAKDDREVWISSIEHPAVLAPARHYYGERLRLIPADRRGLADLDWVQQNLSRQPPALLAMMAANNETGVAQPWQQAVALCREHAVPFFCDAVQWLGKQPAAGLGECDFVAGSAHKFGGPRGVGFLKCPARGRVASLLLGGPQEEGRRAGTENVAGVLSMMTALEIREQLLAANAHEQPRQAKDRFETRLLAEVPGSEIIGSGAPRLWNTTLALMPEADCQQRWVVKLDKMGLAVSTGSACASGKEEPSHVLAAMGVTPAEASRVLRFSSGWESDPAEWLALLEALKKLAAGMDRQAG